MAIKRNALGRGLDSLISMDTTETSGSTAINEIALAAIEPNPEQPRTDFSGDALEELAASIRTLGIIQPLSLRKIAPDRYQIIAGERRFRAAAMAGLDTVPAYIRSANEAELTEIALIENIQREDLNAIEIALTFRKLIDRYNLTQERLSERIGKNRATVANFLRLLRLPAEVQLGLRDKRVDMGHARALLSLSDPALQLELYKRIIKEGLSVRRVEELAKQMNGLASRPKEPGKAAAAEYDVLKKHLSNVFRTTVRLDVNAQGRGKITFPFRDEEEMARLISLFDTLHAQDADQ